MEFGECCEVLCVGVFLEECDSELGGPLLRRLVRLWRGCPCRVGMVVGGVDFGSAGG